MSPPPELTVRAVLLGVAITLVFTAANVYLGLSVGLTFATSIPAAVISMALLRTFAGSSIVENNIVQTVASAAGTLAAIGFVLPGLVMTGWWCGFPFWPTFAVCATGGLLGVLFSIPLRRALVVETDLPFPEGVAAAEVLKVGAVSPDTADGERGEGRAGLRLIALSSIAAFVYAALGETKLIAREVAGYVHAGAAATGLTLGMQLALVGAGHLVGLSVGIAMGVGVLLTWGLAVPIATAFAPANGPAMTVALAAWSGEIRFVGAGAIGVASIWSLMRLAGPLARGLAGAAHASRASGGRATLPVEERDIPIRIVGAGVLLLLPPIALVLHAFVANGPLAAQADLLVAGAILYILVAGAFVASVCGYMAGLIGASNSPLSGIGILAILGAAGLLAGTAGRVLPAGAGPALVAFALIVTGVIFAAATIANDNLQDLKTGQLVGATPWKQQVALMFGVLAGAVVIPFTLDLLNRAHGFAGLTPGAATGGGNPLPAPQATLITALARGVLGGDLDWSMIGIGAALGVALILVDEALGRAGRLRLPPLAVSFGLYLPSSVTIAVVIGAVTGHLFERRRGEVARRMGVLAASGMIVGESLWGVLAAGLIVASGRAEPLALVGPGYAAIGTVAGMAAFAGVIALLYRMAAQAGRG